MIRIWHPTDEAFLAGRAFAAAARFASASRRGQMISGRRTPARICVAPLTEHLSALALASAARRCGSAIGISPKPSVTTSVIPISSEPVMATPRS